MLGISDFGALCAANLLFPALCALATAVGATVRAHPREACTRKKIAGPFGVGFGIERGAA